MRSIWIIPLSALRSTTLGDDPFFGKKKKPLSLFTRAARVLSHFFRVGGSKSFLSNNKSARGVFKSIVPHEEAGPVSKTSALFCEAEKNPKVQNAPPLFFPLY